MNLNVELARIGRALNSLSEEVLQVRQYVDSSPSSSTGPPQQRPEELLTALAAYLSLQPTLQEHQLLENLLQLTMHVTQAEGAGITLYDTQRKRLVFVAAVGAGSEHLVGQEVPLKGSVTGLAFATGEIQAATPRYTQIETDTGVDFRNVLVAPLMVEDAPIGTLGAVNKRTGDMFAPDDIEIFGRFAGLVSVIVRQHRRERQLLEWIRGTSSCPVAGIPDGGLTDDERKSLLLTMELGRILQARPDLAETVSQYLAGLSHSAQGQPW